MYKGGRESRLKLNRQPLSTGRQCHVIERGGASQKMSDPQLEDFVQRYRKAVKRGSASAPSTSVPPATAFLPVNPTTCRYYQLPAYQQTTPTPVHLPFGVAYPNVVYNYRAGVDSSGNRIEEVNVKQLPDEDRRDEVSRTQSFFSPRAILFLSGCPATKTARPLWL